MCVILFERLGFGAILEAGERHLVEGVIVFHRQKRSSRTALQSMMVACCTSLSNASDTPR